MFWAVYELGVSPIIPATQAGSHGFRISNCSTTGRDTTISRGRADRSVLCRWWGSVFTKGEKDPRQPGRDGGRCFSGILPRNMSGRFRRASCQLARFVAGERIPGGNERRIPGSRDGAARGTGRDPLFHREMLEEIGRRPWPHPAFSAHRAKGSPHPRPLSRLAGVRRSGGQCRGGLNTGRGEKASRSWACATLRPRLQLSRPVGAGNTGRDTLFDRENRRNLMRESPTPALGVRLRRRQPPGFTPTWRSSRQCHPPAWFRKNPRADTRGSPGNQSACAQSIIGPRLGRGGRLRTWATPQ